MTSMVSGPGETISRVAATANASSAAVMTGE
jgi:hypothetical protein